jgi:hypothetical protein
MSQRRKLQLIVAVSTVASFIAAAGAMYFATWRFEMATNEAQVERYRQLSNAMSTRLRGRSTSRT